MVNDTPFLPTWSTLTSIPTSCSRAITNYLWSSFFVVTWGEIPAIIVIIIGVVITILITRALHCVLYAYINTLSRLFARNLVANLLFVILLIYCLWMFYLLLFTFPHSWFFLWHYHFMILVIYRPKKYRYI